MQWMYHSRRFVRRYQIYGDGFCNEANFGTTLLSPATTTITITLLAGCPLFSFTTHHVPLVLLETKF